MNKKHPHQLLVSICGDIMKLNHLQHRAHVAVFTLLPANRSVLIISSNLNKGDDTLNICLFCRASRQEASLFAGHPLIYQMSTMGLVQSSHASPAGSPGKEKTKQQKKQQRYFRESDTVVERIHPSGSFISRNSAARDSWLEDAAHKFEFSGQRTGQPQSFSDGRIMTGPMTVLCGEGLGRYRWAIVRQVTLLLIHPALVKRQSICQITFHVSFCQGLPLFQTFQWKYATVYFSIE